jgi:hypothetical protein
MYTNIQYIFNISSKICKKYFGGIMVREKLLSYSVIKVHIDKTGSHLDRFMPFVSLTTTLYNLLPNNKNIISIKSDHTQN